MTGDPMPRVDALTPFVFEHAAVRGAHVRVDTTISTILTNREHPLALRGILAEMVAAVTLLAASLKFTGSLMVQLQGTGPVRLLVVECTSALQVRATVQWDAERVSMLSPQATLAELAGDPAQARMVMTLDPKGAGPIYQGIVALESTAVATLFEHYLATSEQLASRMLLARDGDACAGLLVQRLPDRGDDGNETWTRITGELDAGQAVNLFAADGAAGALTAFFPHDDLRVFAERAVAFGCSCSEERVANALRIAGAEEIESILAERGNVEVTCEFCHRTYTFGHAAARALFSATDPHP